MFRFDGLFGFDGWWWFLGLEGCLEWEDIERLWAFLAWKREDLEVRGFLTLVGIFMFSDF